MNNTASNTSNNRSSGDRALRWIGDLDHPFYSDERNRYVWYEASAIAFQMLFLGSYFMAGLVLFVAGGSAIPYVLAMFVPAMAAVVVFQGYLKRHSAEYWPGKNDLVRRRGQVAIFAGVFLIIGLIRASIDLQDGEGAIGSLTGGATRGLITGLLVGPIAAVAFLVYKARKAKTADEADEF